MGNQFYMQVYEKGLSGSFKNCCLRVRIPSLAPFNMLLYPNAEEADLDSVNVWFQVPPGAPIYASVRERLIGQT